MKILIYSANFAPEPTGIGKYSGEMAAWLVAQGHEVRVVAAPPYYPAWKLQDGYVWPPYQREQWQGVDVWRAPLWVPNKPGGLSRVLHLFTFAVLSAPLMLWQIIWRPDVVFTVAPAFFCAPVGWLTAKLSGAKSWLHIQDFEVDVAFQMGLLKGRLLQRMVIGAERYMIRSFDTVSSISGRMLDKLRQKGVANSRIRYFPNWVDISHVFPLHAPSTYRLLKFNTDFQSNITTFDYGLGEKKGKFKMVENTTNMGNSHIASTHTSEETGIEVIVETLDGVLANVARVDFVKIDVEGFEEGVLNGAIKTINAHQPLIVFEQHENEFVGDSTPSITLLKNLGYEFCWQHRKQPKIASHSYILRRLFDVYRIIFGETLEIKTGPNVPKQYHSMLIAVPKRFVSLMNHYN
jgi:FkbM family methyltransferase